MFLFKRQLREVQVRSVRIRDEWGILHSVEVVQGVSFLTDQELADDLQVGLTTVITHRRD